MENELPGRFIFISILILIAGIFVGTKELTLGTDLKGGAELVYSLSVPTVGPDGKPAVKPADSETVKSAIEVVRKRIDPDGTKGYIIVPSSNRILISLGGAETDEIALIENLLAKQGTLEFRMSLGHMNYGAPSGGYREKEFNEAKESRLREDKEKFVPPGTRWYGDYLIEDKPYIFGRNLKNAQVTSAETPGQYAVSLQFDSTGARALQKISSLAVEHANSGMAIMLNDIWEDTPQDEDNPRKLIRKGRCNSAPSVRSVMTNGGCNITGNFDLTEAKELAMILNSGSLPVEMVKESSIVVGPTLGKSAQDQGKLACGIGIAAVLVFMSIWYKGFGLIASAALLVNLIFVWAGMATFGFVLTLPGIAGLILTIGMAVDANVLIYERIKEELRHGFTITRSVHVGYEKAFVTIFDSNLTTFITGVILYMFGTGPVQGFAITLCLGIVASMFCSIYITRTLVEWQLSKGKLDKTRSDKMLNHEIKFIGSYHKFAAVMSIVMVVSMFIFVRWRGQDNLDIDFTGGSRIQLAFTKGYTAKDVETKVKAALKEKGFEHFNSVRVQPAGPVENGEAQQFIIQTKDQEIEQIQAHLTNTTFAGELVAQTFPNKLVDGQPVILSFKEAQKVEDLEKRIKEYLLNSKKAIDVNASQEYEGGAVKAIPVEGSATTFRLDTKSQKTVQLDKLLRSLFAEELQSEAKSYMTFGVKFKNADSLNETDIKAKLVKALGDDNLILAPIYHKDFNYAIFTNSETHTEVKARNLIEDAIHGLFVPSNIQWQDSGNEVIVNLDKQRDIEEFVEEISTYKPQEIFEGIKAIAVIDKPEKDPEEAAKEAKEIAEGKKEEKKEKEIDPADIKRWHKLKLTLPSTFVDNAKNREIFNKEMMAGYMVLDTALAKGAVLDRVFATDVNYTVSDLAALRKYLSYKGLFILNVKDQKSGGDNKVLTLAKGQTESADQASIQGVDELQAMLLSVLDSSYVKENVKGAKQGVTSPVMASMKIGSAVAGEMTTKAMWSLALSLIAIVIYITYRFEFRFGIAAIVALVHDVTITLGVLALCDHFFGSFKYDLVTVGSILTIVGYSLNDTIVIFDRIRENLRDAEDNDLPSIINASVNQSLSRTILTSVTTLVTVLILFFLGGKDLNPFCVTLIAGLIVGTYSSTFVASPVLLLFGGKAVRDSLRPVEVEDLDND